jgi:2-polyprenyl-3-methyl-5-hydroxy-6-metoxy-1,4-benzoquinol methylase
MNKPSTHLCPLCSTPSSYAFTASALTVHACPECRIEFISPAPDEDTAASIYNRSYYDSWGLDNGTATEKMKKLTFGEKLAVIEQFKKGGGTILDIGCATGFLLEEARDRGWEPYGVEMSPYSSDLARQRLGAERVITGTLEKAGFCDGFFDVIIMTDLLEHIGTPRHFIGEITRVLKPNGIIAITTPDLESLSRKLMVTHWPHYKKEHLVYYRSGALAKLLLSFDFNILHISSSSKFFTINYVNLQLTTYPIPFLTPLIQIMVRFIPNCFTNRPLRFRTGELFMIAQNSGENRP